MSEPNVPRLARGQIIRSGKHGRYVITREAVVGMLEQLQERPVPVNIEHDPTQPPVGRIVGGQLVELADGEVALETDMELFDGPVTTTIQPTSRLNAFAESLADVSPKDGQLELVIDDRSYRQSDLVLLREAAASAGEVAINDGAVRFSVLPDALLIFSLGTVSTAFGWFSKGFFTKLGERTAEPLGEEMGQDLAGAYRRLKATLRDVVSRRTPADRPPLTMLTLSIEREGGGVVEVEGSSRAEGEGLDDLLDSGAELAVVARVLAGIVDEPEQLAKLHFVRRDGRWQFVYGLKDDATRAMVIVVSDEHYAELLTEAQESRQI